MRRHLTTLVLAVVAGGLVLASDAQACHKKKHRDCAPAPVACAPAPTVVVVCEPAPPCPPKKKCCLFGGGGGLFKHKKKGC